MDVKPFSGATLHPAFVMDGAEVNHKYIGRYLGYSYNGTLVSQPNWNPTDGTTIATFRTYAKANGSNYGLFAYYDWDLIGKLYLFGFKTFDAKTNLGVGYTGSTSLRKTGGSDGNSWMYGTSSNTTQMSFLGIEDCWGNLSQRLDNFMSDGTNLYAGQSSSPTATVSDKTLICSNPGISNMHPARCGQSLNAFFIGQDNLTGEYLDGMCVHQSYNSSSSSWARVGAGWGDVAGASSPFRIVATESESNAFERRGARLVMWD